MAKAIRPMPCSRFTTNSAWSTFHASKISHLRGSGVGRLVATNTSASLAATWTRSCNRSERYPPLCASGLRRRSGCAVAEWKTALMKAIAESSRQPVRRRLAANWRIRSTPISDPERESKQALAGESVSRPNRGQTPADAARRQASKRCTWPFPPRVLGCDLSGWRCLWRDSAERSQPGG